MPTHEMPIRTALFVDFDNIFITLKQQDEQVSNQFATNPDKWLAWLEGTMAVLVPTAEAARRRILIRKCYLNPQSFASFRPYFIRSAFEVVDCPPLTNRGKTSTDIHMVMDILDALNHKTLFQEFIILSSDADFTPVLLRLRANDRYSAVLSTGYVSPAYKAACDFVIPQDVFLRDALGISYQEEDVNVIAVPYPEARQAPKALLKRMAERLYEGITLPGGIEASDLPAIYKEFAEFKQSTQWLGFYSLRRLTEAVIAQNDELAIIEEDPWRITRLEYTSPQAEAELTTPATTSLSISAQEIKKGIAEWVINIVKSSANPVTMASLAHGISEQFAQYVADNNWLQTGTFKSFLAQLDLDGLAISSETPGFVYDPATHQTSNSADSANQFTIDAFSAKYPTIATLAKNIHRITDTPYLLPEYYALLLQEIAREVNERGFQLTRTSKTVRDRCVEKGAPVARAHVNFVLTGISYSGHVLGGGEAEQPRALGEIFIGNTINLCRTSQFILSDQDLDLISQWIVGGLV